MRPRRRSLRRLVASGECVRIGRGRYAVCPLPLRREDEHLARARAAPLTHRNGVAASHHSALLLHGLPVFDADLSVVHLTRLADRHTRLRCGGPHPRPAGPRAARHMLGHADGRSGSVGESRLRLGLLVQRLPVVPQHEIREVGELVARVDFLVRGTRVVVEFDGLVTYCGDGGSDAVVAEKLREDRIRSLGYEVVRVTWRELDQMDWVAARVRAAVARGAGPGRVRRPDGIPVLCPVPVALPRLEPRQSAPFRGRALRGRLGQRRRKVSRMKV